MLRRHLSTDRERARALVVTEPEAYRFATELVTLDLDRFDELLERSAREPTRLARASLEQALDLVRGEVLEDEPYSTWALDLRGSYQGRVLGAHLDAADAALAELDFAPALAHAEAAATLDRFSERAHRLEMLALYALGRQHEALARYRSFRMRLDEELGLEPTAETRALEAAIIRQEDVHALLPRPIRRARAETGGRALRLLGRAAELETLTHAVRRALRRRRSRCPDRGRGRARQDANARRAGSSSSRTCASGARAAPSSSSTFRTCRSRRRSARRSPASNSTRAGCRRSGRSCPS